MIYNINNPTNYHICNSKEYALYQIYKIYKRFCEKYYMAWGHTKSKKTIERIKVS